MGKNNMAMLAMTNFCMAFVIIMSCFNIYVAYAGDPSPLQNFCIAANDYQSSVFINGKFCKNPKEVTVNDFIYKGLDIPGNTTAAPYGATALLVDDHLFPAVNTLGVSIARVDFGPFGLNTPHLHPLASEIFAVMEGTLYVGFVSTNYTLYDAVIRQGEVIVFPQGLVHFQLNLGKSPALAIAGFGGQNPGRTDVATALFGTHPPIFSEVLSKAFKVSERVVTQLQGQFENDDESVEVGRSMLKLLTEAT